MMQRDIKDFLRACHFETEKSSDDTNDTNTGISSHERGFFSLGIANDSSKNDSCYGSLAASRARNMELPAGKFVVNVFFPKTNTSTNVRFALEFRKGLARWTHDNESLKQELALVSGEDTSTPSYNHKLEETSCYTKAGEIAQGAFGASFFMSIGTAIKLQAGQFLGFRRSILSWPKGSFFVTVKMKNKFANRIKSVCKAINGVRAVIKENQSGKTGRSFGKSAKVEEALPGILEMAWEYNKRNIAHTVNGAFWRIFLDNGLAFDERLRRGKPFKYWAKSLRVLTRACRKRTHATSALPQ